MCWDEEHRPCKCTYCIISLMQKSRDCRWLNIEKKQQSSEDGNGLCLSGVGKGGGMNNMLNEVDEWQDTYFFLDSGDNLLGIYLH